MALMDLEVTYAEDIVTATDELILEKIRLCLCAWPASLEEMGHILTIWKTVILQEYKHRRRLLPIERDWTCAGCPWLSLALSRPFKYCA